MEEEELAGDAAGCRRHRRALGVAVDLIDHRSSPVFFLFFTVSSLTALLMLSGCTLGRYRIDSNAVIEARMALTQFDDESDVYYYEEDELEGDEAGEKEKEKPGTGSVIVGTMIAVFPGMLVPGLGHRYAGDKRTANRLGRMGQFGLLLTALGGGALVGGYVLDQNDTELFGKSLTDPTAYTLYGTGAIASLIGLTYFFTAWGYDMADTPRAIRERGRPPPRSRFIDSLDIFD